MLVLVDVVFTHRYEQEQWLLMTKSLYLRISFVNVDHFFGYFISVSTKNRSSSAPIVGKNNLFFTLKDNLWNLYTSQI